MDVHEWLASLIVWGPTVLGAIIFIVAIIRDGITADLLEAGILSAVIFGALGVFLVISHFVGKYVLENILYLAVLFGGYKYLTSCRCFAKRMLRRIDKLLYVPGLPLDDARPVLTHYFASRWPEGSNAQRDMHRFYLDDSKVLLAVMSACYSALLFQPFGGTEASGYGKKGCWDVFMAAAEKLNGMGHETAEYIDILKKDIETVSEFCNTQHRKFGLFR